MNFVTTQFVLFFLPVLWLCWYTRGGRSAHLFILCLCNYYFYAHAGGWGVVVLLAVSATAYTSGLMLAHNDGKQKFRTVLFSVGICVFLLCIIAVRLRVKKKVQNLNAMWYKEFAKNFATQGDFGHESP